MALRTICDTQQVLHTRDDGSRLFPQNDDPCAPAARDPASLGSDTHCQISARKTAPVYVFTGNVRETSFPCTFAGLEF